MYQHTPHMPHKRKIEQLAPSEEAATELQRMARALDDPQIDIDAARTIIARLRAMALFYGYPTT